MVAGAVAKFVPGLRSQAATLPIFWLIRACRAARKDLPPQPGPRCPTKRRAELAAARLRAMLTRHAARIVVLAWSFGLRFVHMQRFTPARDELEPSAVMTGTTSLAKDGAPLTVFCPAIDVLGPIPWWDSFLAEWETLGMKGAAFPGFECPWGHAGDLHYASGLTGCIASDETSRGFFAQAVGATPSEQKAEGVSWHSLHGSMADDGSVLSTVPVRGMVITHDGLRCLGWWGRDARQKVDATAAMAAEAGVVAARSRDFSLAVGLPATHTEMLVRYSSGPNRSGVRARAIAIRVAVIGSLAAGVAAVGADEIRPGKLGINQILDALKRRALGEGAAAQL